MPGLRSTVSDVRVSFALLNKHPAFDASVPTMPYIQNIGGLHVREPNPLSKDLDAFVSGSSDAGFIFVSFGSFIQEKTIEKRFIASFVEAFSRIPQRVVWKFKEKITGLPPNVKQVDWAPQQDLLGHPKIRAFVTQGGRYSLMEAIYHGVPLLGIPLFMDQPYNVKRMEYLNLGVALSWNDITADYLVAHINTVTTNYTSFKTSLTKHQALIKDNLMKPADVATYWIEYVIRHNGAHHLRSAAEYLNVAQYFLLDVIACVLLVLITGAYVTYKVLVAVIMICRGEKERKSKERAKKTRKGKSE